MQRLAALFLALAGLCALRAETVLVLPFFNQSDSDNLSWIGESISEAIQESLTASGLLTLEREDRLEAFRRLALRPNVVLTVASVMKAGEALDASEVIYGHYEITAAGSASAASKGTLRITARLLNLKQLRQGPEFEESGALEDLALLEARLSWQALGRLGAKSVPPEAEFLRARPRVRLDALENYIRGLLASSPELQNRFFTQAAHLDERYSQPCFQLGKSYWRKKDYRTAATWLRRVNRSDSRYMEAQFFLGLSDYYLGDYTGAVKCFETVAGEVPLNEVYNDLGAAALHCDARAAIENFRKALDGDRTDPDYHFNLGYALWRAGQFEAAAASFREVLTRNPNDSDAAAQLVRVTRRDAAGASGEVRERLKTEYEETAFRQLKAELESKKN